MNSLKQFIIDKSKELNIDICRFTDCEPALNLKEYLIERKNSNMKTSFEEEDLMKRLDPKLTLDSCKSIIVLGLSYNVDFNEKPDYPLRGRLSKSSWGMDYHRVFNEKMELLVNAIKEKTSFQYKHFVDTGPLIDRELAKKSGVGYYGKNCSIINYEYGSFIFLGYILTDLNLKADNDVEEECGDCRLCIDACPTGALEDAYKLNPKKCISYLTQTKDNIPIELREKIGIKIYGCDTCQLVCPKNKDIKRSTNDKFIPKNTKGYLNIEELLNISNRKFKKKYGTMAGSWRGKTVLKRNAIISLGNMKSMENIEILIKELQDSNPVIREYAQWAIVNIFLANLSGIL